MKVSFELIYLVCDVLIVVMICGAIIFALSRKQLNDAKYDDALTGLTILCLVFTLIGLWVQIGARVIQALIVDYAALDLSMPHVVPYIIAFLIAAAVFAGMYHLAPSVTWIDAEVVRPWIFVAQSSASIFFTVSIAATLVVRACIGGIIL